MVASNEIKLKTNELIWSVKGSRTSSEFESVALVGENKTAIAVGESNSIFQFTTYDDEMFIEVSRHSDFLDDFQKLVKKKQPDKPEESEPFNDERKFEELVKLFYVNIVRLAVLTIVIFLSVHFFRLTRYYLSLSEFYTSRSLGLQLEEMEGGMNLLEIDKLAQLMDSMKAPLESERRDTGSNNSPKQFINWITKEKFDNDRSKRKEEDQSLDD